MQKDVVLLIIDQSEADRAKVRSILGDKVDRILEASDAASAWEALRGVDHLSIMVANIDAASVFFGFLMHGASIKTCHFGVTSLSSCNMYVLLC